MDFVETAIYAVILRVYSYMEETGRQNSFDRFSYLRALTERLTEETLNRWEQDTGEQAKRYWDLLRTIGDGQEDHVLQNALDLCLAAALVPEFAAYLNFYTGNAVTVQLAFALEGISCPSYEEVSDKLKKLGKICRIEWGKIPLFLAAVEADNRLIAYLFAQLDTEKTRIGQTSCEGKVFWDGIWFWCGEKLQDMFVRKELATACAEWMREKGGLLQISGGGGRRFLAKHIAQLLGKNLLLLPVKNCRDLFGENGTEQRGELLRELFWQQGMLCLYGLSKAHLKEWKINEEDFRQMVACPVLAAGVSIILCTDMPLLSSEEKTIQLQNVELTPLSREEREKVFRGLASQYGAKFDCEHASVRYCMSASEIARAFGQWHREIGAQTADEAARNFDRQFSHICCDMLSVKGDKPYGKVCYPSEGLSDLKVSKDVQDVLGQICSSALEGHRIFEEWGLGQQYPYGRAVTVLLAGPPGTGKTMTAHVIANTLGIPLYQVNLSAVMDKYIGETEKHLEEVFAFAEKTNTILFFDEADALFGKRGEVVESRDRYANMEISYILQRVEQFEGVVVLATNLFDNIDRAFLRRMKYVLTFQMPDAALRRSIWESCLPQDVLADELDIAYLSEQFDFSGGMIKNVVLSACVMAVHEGKQLGMGHLLRAVKAEYEKMEWMVSKDMWGEYAYLIE